MFKDEVLDLINAKYGSSNTFVRNKSIFPGPFRPGRSVLKRISRPLRRRACLEIP